MRQLQNELIASPDDGGLLRDIHANTNDVIVSDTMIFSLEPPQISPIIYHHKMMCGCEICNTSKCFQGSLNAYRCKQLKTIKDKADNSSGRKKYELTQYYKSYADYVFPNNETRHPRCENVAYYILCQPTNDEFQFPNWKCVLRKCNACTSIDLPGVERGPLNQASIITFNT